MIIFQNPIVNAFGVGATLVVALAVYNNVIFLKKEGDHQGRPYTEYITILPL